MNVRVAALGLVVAFAASGGSAWAQTDAGAAAPAPAAGINGGGQIVIPGTMMPQPDAPEVRATVGQSTVQLGRRFSLFVTIVRPAGVDVNIPAALPLGGVFEEVRRTFHDETRADGKRVREYELQLMPWAVGDMIIPPIAVTYVINGTARTTQTAPVPIQVTGVIGAGEGKLRDVPPPVSVTRRDWARVWMVAVPVALLLLVVGLWWSGLFRRGGGGRRSPVRRGAPEVPLSPYDEARRRLDLLAGGEAMAAEDRKPLYVEMSEIVRAYLGYRFEFPALDRASSEIRAHVGSRPDGQPSEALLDRWLTEVDLVKYAGMRATADEAGAAIALARELIDTSERTPIERPQPPAPAPVIPIAPPDAETLQVAPPDAETLQAAPPDAETLQAAPPAEAAPDADASDTLRGMGAASSSEPATEPAAEEGDDA